MCKFFNSLRKFDSRCEVILVYADLRGYRRSLAIIFKSVVIGVSSLLRLTVTSATVPSELVIKGVATTSKYVEPPLGDSHSSSVIIGESFG